MLTDRDVLKRAYRTSWIISGSMVFGIVMFGFVALMIVSSPERVPRAAQDNDTLVVVLYAAALTPLVLSGIIKKLIISGRFNLSVSDQSAQSPAWRFINRLNSCHLAVSALCENTALMGMVLTLVTGVFQHYLVLSAAAFAAFAFHWPRYRRWEQALEQFLMDHEVENFQ